MVLSTSNYAAKLHGYALCRKSIQGESAAKRPMTAHASIPSQSKGNSYAQQANNRRGKVRFFFPFHRYSSECTAVVQLLNKQGVVRHTHTNA